MYNKERENHRTRGKSRGKEREPKKSFSNSGEFRNNSREYFHSSYDKEEKYPREHYRDSRDNVGKYDKDRENSKYLYDNNESDREHQMQRKSLSKNSMSAHSSDKALSADNDKYKEYQDEENKNPENYDKKSMNSAGEGDIKNEEEGNKNSAVEQGKDIVNEQKGNIEPANQVNNNVNNNELSNLDKKNANMLGNDENSNNISDKNNNNIINDKKNNNNNSITESDKKELKDLTNVMSKMEAEMGESSGNADVNNDESKSCKIIICLSSEEINLLNNFKNNIWINLENSFQCNISKNSTKIDGKDVSLITFNGTPKQNSLALFTLQKYFMEQKQ